jgi:hypothetical protein
MATLGLDHSAANTIENWLLGIIMTPIFLLTYGLLPLIGFGIVMLILDTLFFIKNSRHVKVIMVMQWLIIVPTFIWWSFEYRYWLWVTLSLTLLVTQIIRSKKIKQIIYQDILERKNVA